MIDEIIRCHSANLKWTSQILFFLIKRIPMKVHLRVVLEWSCGFTQEIISWNLSKIDTFFTTLYGNMWDGSNSIVRWEVNKNCIKWQLFILLVSGSYNREGKEIRRNGKLELSFFCSVGSIATQETGLFSFPLPYKKNEARRWVPPGSVWGTLGSICLPYYKFGY